MGSTRNELLRGIATETERLNRLLANILQMSRLDVGAAIPKMQWHVLEEVVGAALQHTRRDLEHHKVMVRLTPDLPLVHLDDVMLEQVLVNLLENASKYTPRGSSIWIDANVEHEQLWITISDNGPGIPIGQEEKIFDKYHRVTPSPRFGRRKRVRTGNLSRDRQTDG